MSQEAHPQQSMAAAMALAFNSAVNDAKKNKFNLFRDVCGSDLNKWRWLLAFLGTEGGPGLTKADCRQRVAIFMKRYDFTADAGLYGKHRNFIITPNRPKNSNRSGGGLALTAGSFSLSGLSWTSKLAVVAPADAGAVAAEDPVEDPAAGEAPGKILAQSDCIQKIAQSYMDARPKSKERIRLLSTFSRQFTCNQLNNWVFTGEQLGTIKITKYMNRVADEHAESYCYETLTID